MNAKARLWSEYRLVDLLIEEAMLTGKSFGRSVRVRSIYPENRKYEYIDLHRSSGVFAQIHKDKERGDGFVLVIGNADDECPNPMLVDEIRDFEGLSGDGGSNNPWLRSSGKVFGHRNPARAFFVEDDLPKKSGWRDVQALFEYALRRNR